MSDNFILKVVLSALSTVGIEEYIKNFFKPKNKIWYAVMMIPLSVASYVAADYLPEAVLGSVLTIGAVQLCYQSLVQGFSKIIESITSKFGNSTENK